MIVDGGWSKRLHKHFYNAISGVAIIVSKETDKLLCIGVPNKHCSTCTRGERARRECLQHECHKNWDGPLARNRQNNNMGYTIQFV